MTLREVNYLVDSREFLKLTEKYKLKTKIYVNEKIFILSECYVFEIYGLVVEDFFYFDMYSIDLNYYSNIDRLLSDYDSGRIHSVYQLQMVNRSQVYIPFLQGSEENTLKAEQYFFTMLQLMDELLSDILTCKKEIKKEHWSPIFEPKKNQLKVILSDIIAI